MTLVMEEITKPQTKLFTTINPTSHFITINRNSLVNPDYENMFYIFGQLLAVCLINDIFIPAYLCPFFFKDLVRCVFLLFFLLFFLFSFFLLFFLFSFFLLFFLFSFFLLSSGVGYI
jgi:hypothetical protein